MTTLNKRRPAAQGGAGRAARPAPSPSPVSGDVRDAVSKLKRESIVAAAVAIFYHKGYAKTTLEEVADAMGVTKPFIYSHFSSKHDLLAEICRRAVQFSHEAFSRGEERKGKPSVRLHAMAEEFMLSLLTNQAHSVIYSREEKELHPEVAASINQMRRDFDHRLEAVIAEGVALGEFEVPDVALAALSIIGIVAWAQFWFRPDGRMTREQIASGVADMVLPMVGFKKRRMRVAA
jgi:AcrR family transcriptional regulator